MGCSSLYGIYCLVRGNHMATENDWLTHNLYERIENKNSIFEVKIDVNDYRSLNFEQATKEVCEKLYALNDKIYIGLSGGIDSEYVLKKFHSLKIPFTTVIVDSPCYSDETSIAYEICKKYNVIPEIINITEIDIIKQFNHDIYTPFNSIGIGGVPALQVSQYAKNRGGIYVKGEHLVGEHEGIVCVELNEWDFHTDIAFDKCTYNFFLYTPEIVYSMVKEMYDVSSQKFKCDLYKIPYRDKISIKLSPLSSNYYNWIRQSRKFKPISRWSMPHREFLKKYF